jgi:hypothetical protein
MRFTKALIIVVAAACAASCGPDLDDEAPRGELVYADDIKELYRLDRRVDVVALDPGFAKDGCGFLTDRAHEDIETTIAALDPSKDYAVDLEVCHSVARVYIEGFEHSPFECDWMCCHPDLVDIALVYFAIFEALYDKPPNIDGEIYVALEPDRPCE